MTTPERDPREIELLGAALADELTDAESAELAERCAADPTLAAELEALGGTAAQVRGSGLTRWRTTGSPAPWAPPARRRQWPALAAAAVAAFVLGVAGTLAVTGGEEQDAVAGPPGTLGAVEPIDFTGLPEGGSVEASLIAHTWGTETVLEVDGFPVGESVEVVLVTEDGRTLSSGSFLTTEGPLDCEMNGAVLREDVDVVRLVSADGAISAEATLPQV